MAKKNCQRCGVPAGGTFCGPCMDASTKALRRIYWTPERIAARREHEERQAKKGGKR